MVFLEWLAAICIIIFIARRAYRQATTSKNIRVFASDGGGLLEHSSHRETRKQEQRK